MALTVSIPALRKLREEPALSGAEGTGHPILGDASDIKVWATRPLPFDGAALLPHSFRAYITTTEGAPPFAPFKGWEPRTLAP